jgi:hypothetical protein
LTLCILSTPDGHTFGYSGFCGSSNSPDWLFSVGSFLPVKAGWRIPWRCAMIQSPSPFRSSIPVLLLQSFPKGVAVLLAHLYDRKLLRASSVSLDRPYVLIAYQRCISRGSPLRHLFWGALKVAPTTSGRSLASYASLLSALFL